MGRKKAPAGAASKAEEAEPEPPKGNEKESSNEPQGEDAPVVKELKALDDKYLELERECQKEMQELQRKYTERQAPLLEQRQKLLVEKPGEGGDAATGTPALKGFWLEAMKKLPAFEDLIEAWDFPVLEYLRDITKSHVDASDFNKGFKLSFHFAENPYFTNSILWKEYHTEESSPYTGEIEAAEITASEIDWKPGKNVTVEKIVKSTKGGGAKKKPPKAKEEPRDSFFRSFFRHLKHGMPIPDDINLEEARQLCDDSDEDDDEMMGLLMENDHEIGISVRDHLVPFAVRWYTGEAAPEHDDDDDDFDEDGEDEIDVEDEEDDDDEAEEEPPRGKKPLPKRKGGGGDERKAGATAGSAQGKQEECKQQ